MPTASETPHLGKVRWLFPDAGYNMPTPERSVVGVVRDAAGKLVPQLPGARLLSPVRFNMGHFIVPPPLPVPGVSPLIDTPLPPAQVPVQPPGVPPVQSAVAGTLLYACEMILLSREASPTLKRKRTVDQLAMDFLSCLSSYYEHDLIKVLPFAQATSVVAPLADFGFRSVTDWWWDRDRLARVRRTDFNNDAHMRTHNLQHAYVSHIRGAGFRSCEKVLVYPNLIRAAITSPSTSQQMASLVPIEPRANQHIVAQVRRVLTEALAGATATESILENTALLMSNIQELLAARRVSVIGGPVPPPCFRGATTPPLARSGAL